MRDKLFAELLESVGEALDHARGKRVLRTTILPDAPKSISADGIRALRAQVNASQSVFAHYLNVSTKLVQAWEGNRRQPEGAALRLLEIAKLEPTIVFGDVVLPRHDTPATAKVARRKISAKKR